MGGNKLLKAMYLTAWVDITEKLDNGMTAQL